jgi:hypothetical protein
MVFVLNHYTGNLCALPFARKPERATPDAVRHYISFPIAHAGSNKRVNQEPRFFGRGNRVQFKVLDSGTHSRVHTDAVSANCLRSGELACPPDVHQYGYVIGVIETAAHGLAILPR